MGPASDGKRFLWPSPCRQRNSAAGRTPSQGKEKPMLLRRLLFETRFGERLLTLLERRTGLAVVQVEWLAVQRSGEPRAASQPQ